MKNLPDLDALPRFTPTLLMRVLLTGVTVCACMGSVLTVKIVDIAGLTTSGGAILYPLSFVLIALITECYGFVLARLVIHTTLIWMTISALCFYVVDVLPPAYFEHRESQFHTTLGRVPQIIVASMGAWAISVFFIAITMLVLRRWLSGRLPMVRLVLVPFVGIFVSVLIFYLTQFAPILTPGQMAHLIGTRMLFDVVQQAIAAPVVVFLWFVIRTYDRPNIVDGGDLTPMSLLK